MRLSAHPFTVELPAGWEGATTRGAADPAALRSARMAGLTVTAPPSLHLSTSSMPRDRGDFGSGAVDRLGADDVFVAVIEYGPENLGTALFAPAMPRRVAPADFDPNGLQRAMPGQSGMQRFCTENGRPICLYVVLGAHRRALTLCSKVNAVLPRISVAAA